MYGRGKELNWKIFKDICKNFKFSGLIFFRRVRVEFAGSSREKLYELQRHKVR